jgi:hypothetical protein
MDMDIYYSTEDQDKFGKEVKSWCLDRTVRGYAEILGAVDKDGLKAGQFFEYLDKLIGRTKEDPRVSLEGLNYPITSILITNIKDAKSGQLFYKESTDSSHEKPTVYELMAVEPYVNPWNQIEYYKILFNRSDRQELFDD